MLLKSEKLAFCRVFWDFQIQVKGMAVRHGDFLLQIEALSQSLWSMQ
jgi:hypothetical protein